MILKADTQDGNVWACVYNVPTWIRSASELYDALTDMALDNPSVGAWLKLAAKSPGYWLDGGSTFLARDEI